MEDFAFEVRRKLVHICSVVYILIYYFVARYFSPRTAIFVLVFILIALSFVEFLKMRYGKKIPVFHKVFRKNEEHVLSGSIYLMIGTIISFAVFDFSIAATAVLMMIFGDTASALIGRIGNHKIDGFKSTWEGAIAQFLVDVALGFIFLNNVIIIFVMALVATLVETTLKPVDDNLSIPIAAGFAGQALVILSRILNI